MTPIQSRGRARDPISAQWGQVLLRVEHSALKRPTNCDCGAKIGGGSKFLFPRVQGRGPLCSCASQSRPLGGGGRRQGLFSGEKKVLQLGTWQFVNPILVGWIFREPLMSKQNPVSQAHVVCQVLTVGSVLSGLLWIRKSHGVSHVPLVLGR